RGGWGQVQAFDPVALEGRQALAEAAGVGRGGYRDSSVEGGDGQCCLGRPAPVDGGPSHAGPGRHAVDGESGVALLDQDLQRSLKDRLVIAGVARSSRPPRGGGSRAVTAPWVGAAAGAPARLADAGHRLLAAPLQNYFTDSCVMISGRVSVSTVTILAVTLQPVRNGACDGAHSSH